MSECFLTDNRNNRKWTEWTEQKKKFSGNNEFLFTVIAKAQQKNGKVKGRRVDIEVKMQLHRFIQQSEPIS